MLIYNDCHCGHSMAEHMFGNQNDGASHKGEALICINADCLEICWMITPPTEDEIEVDNIELEWIVGDSDGC